MGLLSLFKKVRADLPIKKKAAAPIVKTERGNSSSTRNESFCDLNELIPSDSTTVTQPTGEMPKSQKKYPAPAAPEPQPTSSSGEAVSEEPLKSVEKEEHKSEKEELNGLSEEKLEMPKEVIPSKTKEEPGESKRAVSSSVVHDVIHYSPHGTVRASTFSPPPPESDVPFVERKSNILLNDTSGYKTIRVTQFDGTIGRAVEKARAPIPPMPATSSVPPVIKSKAENSSTAKSPSLPKKTYEELSLLSPDGVGELRKAAEITQDYETLKAKFDLWQALQSSNRHSPEARQLHMELIHQHDSLMKKLQQVTDTTIPTAKKRPSIATDTFSPWSSNGTPKTPNHYRRPGSTDSRHPISSYSTHSALSNHSLSPTTSTSSDDTEHSLVIIKSSRSITTGHSPAPTIRRADDASKKHQMSPRTQKVASSDASARKEEQDRATLRIIEEANELKRKEYELREANGTMTSPSPKSPVRPSLPRRVESPLSPRSNGIETALTRSSAQKTSHQRLSSDGNNNSIRNGSSATSTSLANMGRNSPIVSPPVVQKRYNYVPPSTTHFNEILYGTWSGSTSSLLPRDRLPNISQQKTERPKTSRPYIPPLSNSSLSTSSNDLHKQFSPVGRIISKSTQSLHAQLSAISVDPVPAKRPPTGLRSFPSQPPASPTPPLTPNADSNIRKVKEAVRQQTLGQKAANKILKSQTDSSSSLQRSTNSQNSSKATVAPNRAPLPSRSENGEITNNISKTLKQGLPALKKVGTPVEKRGITLGKVLDPNSGNNTEPSRTTSNQQTSVQEATVFAQLPPLTPPPPPPPPPPTLLASPPRPPSASSLGGPPPAPPLPHSTSLISMRDLEQQKTKLKPAGTVEKPAAQMDVRDSLMAEIRNAGGLRALRKTTQN